MKRVLLHLIYLIPFSLFSQTIPEEVSQRVLTDYEILEKWSPKLEGSQNESLTLSFIQDRLLGLGVSWEIQDFQRQGETHSFSKNIIVTLPSTKLDTLIVALPLGEEGGRSSSLSLALALELIARVKDIPQPLTLKFLFLGAERGTGAEYPMGSQRFLSQYFPETTAAVLYMDFNTFPQRLQLYAESGGQISPIWLLERVTGSLRTTDLNFLIHGNHPQVFRFNLPGRVSLINPFFQQNIPALYIANGEESLPPEERALWIHDYLQFFQSFLSKSLEGLPGYWDHQYLFFQIQTSYFILNQQQYLLIFLLITSFLLGFGLFQSKKIRPLLSHTLKNFWQLPLIFILLFLFLSFATLILQHLFDLRQFESLWEFAPFLFLGLKVFSALFLFSLFFHQVRRVPLSRWSRFYDTSAILILALMVLAAVGLGLAFSFYFLWALVFSIAFSLVQWRPLKFLLLLGGPFWFLKAAVELFFLEPDTQIIQGTILDPTWGNLILCLLVFPFLLQTSSFHFMKHQKPQRNERLWALVFTGIWGGVCLILILVLVNFNPFDASRPIPVTLTEVMDVPSSQRTLKLLSPVPLPEMDITLEGGQISIGEGTKSQTWELPTIQGLLSTQLDTESFLDRASWSLTLGVMSPPYQLDIELTSEKDIVILDCNFPYVIYQGGRTAHISIGKNPPLPIRLELTILQDRAMTMDLTYTFSEYPMSIRAENNLVRLVPSLTLKDRIFLYTPPAPSTLGEGLTP